jgi:hypothetical protein
MMRADGSEGRRAKIKISDACHIRVQCSCCEDFCCACCCMSCSLVQEQRQLMQYPSDEEDAQWPHQHQMALYINSL